MNDGLCDLDGDDRFLIRHLYHHGVSIPDIARKRLTNETLVEAVLRVFEKNASEQVKKKDFRQASFWFFQHSQYLLKGHTYAKLDVALRRCERDWPNFGKFLEGETKEENINDTSKWAEVEELWNNNFQKYSSQSTDETSNMRYESRTGQAGGGLITIDTEEQYMDAVCKITLNGQNHSGSFVQIDSQLGILTFHSLLTDKEQCTQATVKFEKLDGGEIIVPLLPDEMFISNKELGTAFIACDTTELKDEIEPLSKTGEVEKDAPIYTYFHYDGKQKVHMQQKIITTNSNLFGFDGKFKEGSVGAPLYCQDKLIGMAHGNQMSSKFNQAISIEAIGKWLKKEIQNLSVPQFSIGEEVMATWTDGFEYNARIKKKTVKGYLVHYYQFGDTEEDQVTDTIKSIRKNTASVKVTQTHTTTTATTATTTTITTTKITKISPESTATPTATTSLGGNKEIDKMKKTTSWLLHLKLQKYEIVFKEHGIYYEDMITWKPNEIEARLLKAGCKSGSIMKFQNAVKEAAKGERSLKSYGLHDDVKKIKNKKIKSIENFPMSIGWKPSNLDVDLSSEFQKPDGNYSIRYGCQKIANGYIPTGVIKGVDSDIYVFSSRFKKYFKISISWIDADEK